MGIPLALGDATDATDAAIQVMILKTSKIEKESFYDKYFNIVTGVTELYEKDSSLSGLGQASRIVENAVITSESPVQGFDKTYTQVNFGKVLAVTKDMWRFGIKKRKLEGIVNQLFASCERKREQLCGDRLDNSFATSYTVSDDSGNYTATISGGDAVAAISNSHTREDGGTNWNNRVTDGTTVNMDMDYDAIEAAHRTASLIKDPKGQLMNVDLDSLIVRKNHASHFRAKQMLGAIKAGGKGSLPGTSDNDAAGVAAYKIIATPWISTNTNYWWMMDSKMKGDDYGFQYKESEAIHIEGPHIVFKTSEIQYKGVTSFDIGFNDARNIVGSKNTNAA